MMDKADKQEDNHLEDKVDKKEENHPGDKANNMEDNLLQEKVVHNPMVDNHLQGKVLNLMEEFSKEEMLKNEGINNKKVM